MFHELVISRHPLVRSMKVSLLRLFALLRLSRLFASNHRLAPVDDEIAARGFRAEKYFSRIASEKSSWEETPSMENSSVSRVAWAGWRDEASGEKSFFLAGNGKTELTGARIITTRILFHSSSVFDSRYREREKERQRVFSSHPLDS